MKIILLILGGLAWVTILNPGVWLAHSGASMLPIVLVSFVWGIVYGVIALFVWYSTE